MKKINILFLLFIIVQIPLNAQVIDYNNLDQAIYDNFNSNTAKLDKMMSKGTLSGATLYDFEGITHNLLKYALQRNSNFISLNKTDKNSLLILNKLADLMVKALESRIERKVDDPEINIQWDCDSDSYITSTITTPYFFWGTRDADGMVSENLINSSQFLALASQALNGFASIPTAKRSISMKNFINKYFDILFDHEYHRWITNTENLIPLTIKNGDCKDILSVYKSGNYENRLSFLLNSSNDTYTNKHCNALRDVDLWLLDGISNTLAAYYKLKKEKHPLTKTFNTVKEENYLSFLDLGIQVLNKRSLSNTISDKTPGFDLDKGKLSTFFPDYKYCGTTTYDYPCTWVTETEIKDGKKTERSYNGFPKNTIPSVGWDISHGYRIIHTYIDLYFNSDVVNTKNKISVIDLQHLSNQFAYKIYNGDTKKPAFNNYFDGSNGWYRVGYLGRKGYGIPPFGNSIAAAYGYGFLQYFNSDIKTVMDNVLNMINSTDKNIIKFRKTTYGSFPESIDSKNPCYTLPLLTDFDYERPEPKNSKANSIILLKFLPSLTRWNPWHNAPNSKKNSLLTSTPLSIENTFFPNSEINIYPNPSSDYITISNAEGYSMEIYNALGCLIYAHQSPYHENNAYLSVKTFNKGQYFIRFNSLINSVTKILLIP